MKLTWRDIVFILFLSIIFLILVATSEAGVVTGMEWNAVTLNSDGTPCTDLSGYKVYCTKTPPTYVNGQNVGNVLTANLSTITAMSTDGLYTCVLTAFDVWNNESDYSNSVAVQKKGTSFFGPDTLSPGAANGLRLK